MVLFPYLARVLEKDSFGKALFAQSFVAILVLLPEYGFGLSTTRQIASYKNDVSKIKEIVWETIGAKFLLTIPVMIFLSLSILIVPVYKSDSAFYFASFLLLLFSALNVDWYFYGTENFKFAVVVQIITKLALLFLVIALIDSPNQGSSYVIYSAISIGTVSVANLIYIIRRVGFSFPTLSNSVYLIKSSFPLFLFKLLISFYTSINTVIIGLIYSPSQVSIFAGGERIVRAITGVWQPLGVVLFPRLSSLISVDKAIAYRLFKKALFVYLGLGTSLTIIVYIFSNNLVRIFLGAGFNDSVVIIQIMAPSIFLIALSNIIGINWLLPNRKDRQFNLVIAIAAISNILLGIPATIAWGIWGTAFSALFAEFIVTFGCLFIWRKMKYV